MELLDRFQKAICSVVSSECNITAAVQAENFPNRPVSTVVPCCCGCLLLEPLVLLPIHVYLLLYGVKYFVAVTQSLKKLLLPGLNEPFDVLHGELSN